MTPPHVSAQKQTFQNSCECKISMFLPYWSQLMGRAVVGRVVIGRTVVVERLRLGRRVGLVRTALLAGRRVGGRLRLLLTAATPVTVGNVLVGGRLPEIGNPDGVLLLTRSFGLISIQGIILAKSTPGTTTVGPPLAAESFQIWWSHKLLVFMIPSVVTLDS